MLIYAHPCRSRLLTMSWGSLPPLQERQICVLKWLGLNQQSKPDQILETLKEFKWVPLSHLKLKLLIRL